MRILVVGASGGVGSEIVSQLLALPNPPSIRVSSRDPSKATFPSSVEVVQGDLTNPSTYSRLFSSIDRVFLYHQHGVPLTELCSFIKAAGVQYVVFLSSMTCEFMPQSSLGVMHLQVEDAIKAASLPYTFIRPGYFASNARQFWAQQIEKSGQVAMPYPNFHCAAIAEDDIAAVAVVALTTDQLVNQAPIISGPEDLAQVEQLALISDVRKKAGKAAVPWVELTKEQWREKVKENLPAGFVESVVTYWKRWDGKPEEVRSVEQYTGRKGTTCAQWLEKHQTEFIN